MRILFTFIAILIAAPLFAQTPTSGTFTVYVTTAPTVPVGTPAVIPVGVGGFVCNQPAVTGVTVNPNKIEVDDPVNVGQVCLYTDTGAGALSSLPFTSPTTQYQGTVKWTFADGTVTGESLPSLPFTHLRPVPTGVRVIR
jgi:hypothetical protein